MRFPISAPYVLVPPLKHPILIIHHHRPVHQPPQPLHKLLVRLILLDIVIPILDAPKLDRKPMRDPPLQTLGRVILSALQRQDVRLACQRMQACGFEGEEAGASLFSMSELKFGERRRGTYSFDVIWVCVGLELEEDGVRHGCHGVYRGEERRQLIG